MRSKRLGLILALITALILPSLSLAYESKIVAEYLKAVDARDDDGKIAIIKENMGRIPSEVKALLYEAAMARTSQDDKEANYQIAEMLAKTVFSITGDSSLLIEVKQTVFNHRLSPQVRSKLQGDVHIVEFPKTPAGEQHTFKPDNIEISAGETVRWVNKDEVAHIFASMPIIGKGGLFTPNIEPDKHWEYKFDTPGDYYYICFIHKGMIGKITVMANVDTPSTEANKAPVAPTLATPVLKSIEAPAAKEVAEPKANKAEPVKKAKPPETTEDDDPFNDY